MQSSLFSIKEDELGELAIDLVSKADEVSEIFVAIDNKMIELKSHFDCSSYNSLMNSYNEFRKNYSIVKNTLLSYSDDLISVINKVREGDKEVALNIELLVQDPLEEAKKLEQLGGVLDGFRN